MKSAIKRSSRLGQKQLPANDFFNPPRDRAAAYHFTIRRMRNSSDQQAPIPAQVTLLRPNPTNPCQDQLLIDQVPIPTDAWSYDAHDRILTWKGAYGGGQLHLYHNGRGGTGTIGAQVTPCSVAAGVRWHFSCDVALNAGISYVSSGIGTTGFTWDPTSSAWKNAAWSKPNQAGQQRMHMTFTQYSGTITDPGELTVEIDDNFAQDLPQSFTGDSLDDTLTWVEQLNDQGTVVNQLYFQPSLAPMDTYPLAPGTDGPSSVFPYWVMQGTQDTLSLEITGAFSIPDDNGNSSPPNGILVGFQGQPSLTLATGYYRTCSTAAPFGMFEGHLVLDGKPVAQSSLSGNQLSWSGLDCEQQQRTGLPASGCLCFHPDGDRASDSQQQIQVHRLATTTALDAIAQHADLHPTIHQQVLALHQALADTSALNPQDLYTLTPMAQDTKGNWYDSVQAVVTGNLSTMMNSFVPSDLWKLAFPGISQPILTGNLAAASNTPVSGVTNPGEWYQSLAVAVLTQGLAGGADPYCQYLNGPRAAKWLRTQVAGSAVYQTHSQVLFQDAWVAKSSVIANFQTDQQNGDYTPPSGPNDPGGVYYAGINTYCQQQLTEIKTKVIPDPNNPDAIQQLESEVIDLATYAIESNLYWAYRYYLIKTAPGTLNWIVSNMTPGAGSADGTTMTRNFQSCVSVLTALDPSGTFAQKYVETINICLATNILPSMHGLNQAAIDPDVFKQYLQTLLQTIQASGNQSLIDAMGPLQTVMNSSDADQQIQSWTQVLQSIADTTNAILDLPRVTEQFVAKLQAQYPTPSNAAECMGGAIVGGLAGLGIYNLVTSFKQWSQMTPDEKYSVIENTVQLGLQIVGGIVIRAFRAFSMFSVDSMTTAQRAMAIGKILLTGDAEALDQGLAKIGNSFARYLADTTTDIADIVQGDEMDEMLVRLYASGAEEEAEFVTQIFGDNLEEFMTTRIGPLFILAGMGYGIYSLIEKDKDPLSISNDALGLVGGALTLFALVGEWAVAAELVAEGTALASFMAAAGPLAILVALAGIGLMLYELFQPAAEDNVEQFRDQYASPNGFSVASKVCSIDYARSYANPDQNNLTMGGFSLSANNQTFYCNPNGSITLTQTPTHDPACVWQVKTDGMGMSQIFTVAQPPSSTSAIALYLSQMSDGSVSFQPLGVSPAPAGSSTQGAGLTVVTQTWWSVPLGCTLTSDGKNLATLAITLQPIPPEAKGNYDPAQKSGWLAVSSSGLTINASQGSNFTLTMVGLQPSFLTMKDLAFYTNTTPAQGQTFGPSYVLPVSLPLSFSLAGDPLPAFLSFDQKTGTVAPNGQPVTTVAKTTNTLTVTNLRGSQTLTFAIAVTAPTVSLPSPASVVQPAGV